MTASEKPWTPPNLPLRVDATDEEIAGRYWHLVSEYRDVGRFQHPKASITIARELASAVSAEKDAELAKWKLVAAEVSLAIAGTDVSTPEAFRTAQASAAVAMVETCREREATDLL